MLCYLIISLRDYSDLVAATFKGNRIGRQISWGRISVRHIDVSQVLRHTLRGAYNVTGPPISGSRYVVPLAPATKWPSSHPGRRLQRMVDLNFPLRVTVTTVVLQSQFIQYMAKIRYRIGQLVKHER